MTDCISLESRVNKTDSGCWEWIGWKDSWGYGRIKIKSVARPAHRLAWEIYRGIIPKGLWVLHHCDNPPCINPDHLFLGTHLDNCRDKVAKGRESHSCGELNSHCRLSEREVIEIRALSDSVSQSELAKRYRVSTKHIGEIIARRRWKHLSSKEAK